MIYNNYPDDYIVINAKWVEWDNDEQRWFFMTEDAFEKAQSLFDYTKQVRKEVCEKIRECHDEEERNIDRLVENVENLCSNDLKPMWDKWHEEMTKQIKETIKGE